ncbi:MAG: hypothetical protein JW901_10830, partial [Dehalococcoidia bacterium]|nr:hypothetical protein [Dehalococcoidia bacterium]
PYKLFVFITYILRSLLLFSTPTDKTVTVSSAASSQCNRAVMIITDAMRYTNIHSGTGVAE